MTVCAKESFAFDAPDGAQVVVRRGQLFPENHPYVKGHEKLFEAADTAAARAQGTPLTPVAAVETATAAPGERRSVTRGGKVSPQVVPQVVPQVSPQVAPEGKKADA